MNKLGIVLFAALTLLLSACSESPEPVEEQVLESSEPTHPNVIFILADDMGFGDVGYNGSEIATPNLDQMAAAGVTLDRNYVYPICSPTRAGLMTGHNPLYYGIDGPMSDSTGLPLDLKIMPEYFKDLGYQTFMVGKWHLGLGRTDYWPISRGFDSHYGFLSGWIDYYTHVYAGGLDWTRDGATLREQGYTTDLLTDEALRVIESRDADNPFFLYLTYNAPHSPLQTPPIESGLNGDLEPGNRYVYGEMVTYLDAAIGQVLAAIEAAGISENTLVVFSSDNGGATNLGANNGELRGSKGGSLEGGMRVPGLVFWPGHLQSGSTLEQPIAVFDWLPTLLDAVGGDSANAIDPYGQSMWSAISRGAHIDRARMIIGARDNMAAFDWPWKLVRMGEDGEYELYKVDEDPSEQANLAEQYPDILDGLVAMLEAKPEVPSKQDYDNRGSGSFYAGGEDVDYEARLQESRPPWADQAVKSDH